LVDEKLKKRQNPPMEQLKRALVTCFDEIKTLKPELTKDELHKQLTTPDITVLFSFSTKLVDEKLKKRQNPPMEQLKRALVTCFDEIKTLKPELTKDELHKQLTTPDITVLFSFSTKLVDVKIEKIDKKTPRKRQNPPMGQLKRALVTCFDEIKTLKPELTKDELRKQLTTPDITVLF
jgi:thymidylate kinase